jgi:hypothetical protein
LKGDRSNGRATHFICADVQAKHEAIQQIERSVGEIAQMFSDLAVLVDEQGATLDRIEENVTKYVCALGAAVCSGYHHCVTVGWLAGKTRQRLHPRSTRSFRAPKGQQICCKQPQENVLPDVGFTDCRARRTRSSFSRCSSVKFK